LNTPDITIRVIRESDKSFVYACWLNNFKESPTAKRITHSIYFKKQQRLIERIIERPGTIVQIACLPDDENQILGFLVHENTEDGQVVHYAFVKALFQRLGICTQLMKEAGINPQAYVFTHWTPVMHSILQKNPSITYDPYRT
jgi:hypothetical protein